jgi:hypothetical protein
VTTGIAIVGASVLAATPTLATPPDMKALNPAISHADVNPASFITDLVEGFNTVSVAGGHAAQIGIDTIAGLPIGLAGAANAAIANPSNIPNIVNFLAYSFLNPAYDPHLPSQSVLFQFGSQVIFPLATLLPPPLATAVLTAFSHIGSAIGAGLALLPGDHYTGAFAVGVGIATLPGIVGTPLEAFKILGDALGAAIGGTVLPYDLSTSPPTPNISLPGIAGWFGRQPIIVLATLQAAIADPSAIPGLLSYLTYNLLAAPSPVFLPEFDGPTALGFPSLPFPYGSTSLFTAGFAPIALALGEVLPAPLAHAFEALSGVLGDAIAGALGLLPTPNNPFVPGPSLVAAKFGIVQTAAPKPQTPVEALETSVKVLLGSIEALPRGIEDLATAVQKGYITVPEAVGSLVIGLLDTSQIALKPIIAQLAMLPAPIGPSKGDPGLVIKGATALGNVVGEIEAALPQPKKPVRALQAADAQASAISAIPHKKPEFNVTRILDPFQLDAKKDKSDSETKDKSGPANLLGLPSLPKHQLGDGKISVKELAKKLGLVHPKKDKDEKPAAAAAE